MVSIKNNDTKFVPRSLKQSALEALVITVIKEMEDMESFASLAEQVLGIKVLYVAEDSEELIVVVPDEETYFDALGEFQLLI